VQSIGVPSGNQQKKDIKMKIKRYGSMEVYQQLGLLSLMKPKAVKFRWYKPETYIDKNGVQHIDTWIKPVAGQELLTLVG
jgi:hypothetical protein